MNAPYNPYDPTRFYVRDGTGEKVTVASLTTYQAEQMLCKLLTLISDIRTMQQSSCDSLNRKITDRLE